MLYRTEPNYFANSHLFLAFANSYLFLTPRNFRVFAKFPSPILTQLENNYKSRATRRESALDRFDQSVVSVLISLISNTVPHAGSDRYLTYFSSEESA